MGAISIGSIRIINPELRNGYVFVVTWVSGFGSIYCHKPSAFAAAQKTPCFSCIDGAGPAGPYAFGTKIRQRKKRGWLGTSH